MLQTRLNVKLHSLFNLRKLPTIKIQTQMLHSCFQSFRISRHLGGHATYRTSKGWLFFAEFSTFKNEAFLRMEEVKDGVGRSGASRRSRSNSNSSSRKSRNRAQTGGQKSARPSESRMTAKVMRVPDAMTKMSASTSTINPTGDPAVAASQTAGTSATARC